MMTGPYLLLFGYQAVCMLSDCKVKTVYIFVFALKESQKQLAWKWILLQV